MTKPISDVTVYQLADEFVRQLLDKVSYSDTFYFVENVLRGEDVDIHDAATRVHRDITRGAHA